MADLIFETITGSHLYGMNHADSDVDVARVTYSTSAKARHHKGVEQDTMTIPWTVFLIRILEGSHQSVEVLFSREKVWNPDYEYLQAFTENYVVTGSEVFAKYERTIKKFCYGDFKRRRHAVRLSYNLRELRGYGRFNPRMTDDEIRSATNLANAFSGDDLKGALLG